MVSSGCSHTITERTSCGEMRYSYSPGCISMAFLGGGCASRRLRSCAASSCGVIGLISKRDGSELFEIKAITPQLRSEEHTSELQSRGQLLCRLLVEKEKTGCISAAPRVSAS